MSEPHAIPSLRARLIHAAHQFSAYLPEPLDPADCDELVHIMEDVFDCAIAQREREVWERAATDMLARDAQADDSGINGAIEAHIQYCREQAGKVKP